MGFQCRMLLDVDIALAIRITAAPSLLVVLYILESNLHLNVIRTSFCRFLKRKKLVRGSNPHLNVIRTSFCRFLKRKKLVRGSNLHLSFNRPLPTRQTDSVMSDDSESDE